MTAIITLIVIALFSWLAIKVATTALMMPPSLKAVGIYAVYLLVVFIRPRGLFGSI